MQNSSLRIPPGPNKKFGATEELLGWLGEHLARYGDIYRASIYGRDVYVISSPAYAEHILLHNWQNYIRKGQAVKRIALSLGNGLISSNGEFWVNQRRMIQPAFNRNAIAALVPMIRRVNMTLLDSWKRAARRKASVNVTRDVSLAVLEITLRAIFSEDYAGIAPHFKIVAEESRNLEFAQTLHALGKVVIRIAAQRRDEARTHDDILGALMLARDREAGRQMPDAQLAREILTIIVAGHETTASVLNWTWYLLSRHSEIESKLSAELTDTCGDAFPAVDAFPELTYTRRVVEEALRLYPPLWLMTRRAVHDDRLGDYFVPAGTEIYISPYLIQRHPALWGAAEQFDPDRFSRDSPVESHRLANCPFGAGPRNCIGEFLARIEMQTHLMVIAKELRLRHDTMQSAEIVAGMNLLSRHDFIMYPQIKASIAI